jgi:hypothetical protein
MSYRPKLASWILALTLLALICAYAFAAHPYHTRWGATEAEQATPLPGDYLISPHRVISTRALTVHAPIATVWPWLNQLGQERAGFYSYDWLENLFLARMNNADRIVPELQGLAPGDRVSYMANGPEGTYATVDLIEPGRYLSLGGWTYYLQPVDARTTRFIVRYPGPIVKTVGDKLYYYAIFEPVHFIMESGMMMGIKYRAERAAAQEVQP